MPAHGQSVDLFTLTHLVSEKRQVFMGYACEGEEGSCMSGIFLKSDKDSRISFGPQHRIIVLTDG